MHKSLWIIILLLFAAPAMADFNALSELSHATGGAIVAGAVTATVADRYWPERRGIVGFSVSTAVIMVGEGVQYVQGETFPSVLQDVLAHALGALTGAVVTDRYILSPVVELDRAGNTRIGIVMQSSF